MMTLGNWNDHRYFLDYFPLDPGIFVILVFQLVRFRYFTIIFDQIISFNVFFSQQEWYGLPDILFEEIERAPNPACITSYISQISTLLSFQSIFRMLLSFQDILRMLHSFQDILRMLLSFQDILRMLLSFWRFTSAKRSNEEMSTAAAGCKKAKKWNSTKGRKSTRGRKSHLLSGGGKCQELSVFWSLSTSIKK